MTPIESPDEAEWDAFHEWLDKWAVENKLNPSQAKRLIDSSGDMLEALKSVKSAYASHQAYDKNPMRVVNPAIEKAEAK